MSKVIRISEETFLRLQEHAEPLIDTPATVIERLLDYYERQQRRPDTQKPLHSRRSWVSNLRLDASLSAPMLQDAASEAFGDYEYAPITPGLFLALAPPDDVAATIARAVPYTKAERLILPRQRIQLKRALEDASTFHCYAMSESNRSVFESMRPGDYVLISELRTGKFNFLARILTKFESEELGRELWTDENRESLSLIYAIEEIKEVKIDKAKLNKALGYSGRFALKGAMRVDPKRLEPLMLKFGSVEELLWDL